MKMNVNNELIDEKNARVSVFDHGFLYGIGVFETIRVYGGHIFLLSDHISRLNAGLKCLNINLQFSNQDWENKIKDLLSINSLSNAVVRIMVTGGNEGIGLSWCSYDNPNFFISLTPVSFSQKAREKKIHVLKTHKKSPGGAEFYKNNNYINQVIARKEVINFTKTEGLMLTSQGYLAEGIVSNLFFLKEDKLYTPNLELGILPGITRNFIIYLCSYLDIKVEEGNFLLEDLDSADEIFFTNSVQEIMPVDEWRGVTKDRHFIDRIYNIYRLFTDKLKSYKELGEFNEIFESERF